METFERGKIHPTAVVSRSAALGDGVTVGPFAVIHDGVELGEGSVVGSHCVLGEPTAAFYDVTQAVELRRCVVGAHAVIRSHSALYQGVTIGSGLHTGHHVTIREGSIIGEDVQIGTLSDIQGDLSIGDHARLHSNVHLGRLSRLESYVWIFPFVVLTNDPHPPSDSCTQGATVRRFAVIAANSVVMPGVEIGENSLVGAMSLVTADVPSETVVVGAPARPMGSVRDIACNHGELDAVYPWPRQFRRGYPDGALPTFDEDESPT